MPFVIREHPTLLALLNGVQFLAHACGSISEEIDEVTAELFLVVPGHRLAEDHETPGYVAPVKDGSPAADVATTDAQKPAATAGGRKNRQAATQQAAVQSESAASSATEGNGTLVTGAVEAPAATVIQDSAAASSSNETPAPAADEAATAPSESTGEADKSPLF